MIISCEACGTRYRLAEGLLPQNGAKVRCSQCAHVFTAYPPAAPDLNSDLNSDLASVLTEDEELPRDLSRQESAVAPQGVDDDRDFFFSEDDFESFSDDKGGKKAASSADESLTPDALERPLRPEENDRAEQTLDGLELEELLDQNRSSEKVDEDDLQSLTRDLENLFQSDDFPKDSAEMIADPSSRDEDARSFEAEFESLTLEDAASSDSAFEASEVTAHTPHIRSDGDQTAANGFERADDASPQMEFDGPRASIIAAATAPGGKDAAGDRKLAVSPAPAKAKAESRPHQVPPVSQKAPIRPSAPALPPRRKSRKWLWLLLLLLLMGLAFGGYSFFYRAPLTLSTLPLPFIDRLLPADRDPHGILEIKLTDISSRFVNNQQSGELFIISGQARNGYSMARHTIKITGRLFTQNKNLIQTRQVIAGYQISEVELKELDIQEISQRLQQAPETLREKASVTVQPGRSIPFMLIFWNFPADLDEFILEVAGSST